MIRIAVKKKKERKNEEERRRITFKNTHKLTGKVTENTYRKV